MGVEINKIYNEDCFITMSNMDDNFIDIVMTSPPYNIYADEGYVVYDPFMGTGTTANACVLNGLNYIGSELSPKQCDYAKTRIEGNKNNLFSL